MTAAAERSALVTDFENTVGKRTEKAKGFLTSHPFAAAAVAAILCLCILQVDRNPEKYFVGGLRFLRPPVALALSIVALAWAWDRLIRFEEKRLVCAVYICGFVGVEFLLWRLLSLSEVAIYVLPFLGAGIFALDCIRNKLPSGAAFVCVGLSWVAAFGFNLWVFGACAFLASAFAYVSGLEYPLWKRIISAAFPVVGAVCAYIFYDSAAENVAQTLLVALLALVVCAALSIVVYKGLSSEQFVFIMFAAGFAIRLYYVLGIQGTQNQHDVWSFGNTDAPKHNLYIRFIYEYGKLPQNAENLYDGLSQFYHPPLHHALAALWMRIQTAMGIEMPLAYENVQYLTLFYSSAIMVASKKLFEEFRLKETGLAVACAVIAFHPTFYILAGSINNDVLCILLFVLAMLYSVRFYKNQSIGNTVALALCIGLGMMAKLNVALVAIGTGMLFLYMLFCKENGGFAKSFKRLWKRFVLFGSICVPLGLWWSIYLYVRFDMPLGYVPSMSSSSTQFVGDKSFLQRIFGFNALRLGNIYPNIGLSGIDGEAGAKFYDYGILPYSIKSSLFGEYFYKHGLSTLRNGIAYVLMLGTLVLIGLAIFSMLKYFFCGLRGDKLKGEHSVGYQYLVVCYAVMMTSYIMFCFSYPFTCTMDFRYIVPLLPIAAIFIAKLFDSEDIIKSEKARFVLGKVAVSATIIFSLSSAFFYSF